MHAFDAALGMSCAYSFQRTETTAIPFDKNEPVEWRIDLKRFQNRSSEIDYLFVDWSTLKKPSAPTCHTSGAASSKGIKVPTFERMSYIWLIY